jgi:hypothetical protein
MKGQLNPELNVGDRIMCFHMEGETSVPPGTTGTVVKIQRDPFESPSDKLIEVRWDNGSTLALISSTDAWKLVEKKPVQEQTSGSNEYDFFSKNPEVFENFDYRFFKKYLLKLRESGVINMFQASPFLYSGQEWIDRYYGENQEDNEPFQELLEMADESRNKMIQGLLKYMESQDMDTEDINRVNSLMRKLAMKINQFYITFA